MCAACEVCEAWGGETVLVECVMDWTEFAPPDSCYPCSATQTVILFTQDDINSGIRIIRMIVG
jgi:hypothetical protein